MVQAAFILSFPSSCWITSFIHLYYILAKPEFTGELPAVPIGSWNILSWRDPQESSSLTSDPAVHCKGAADQAPTYLLPTALLRIWGLPCGDEATSCHDLISIWIDGCLFSKRHSAAGLVNRCVSLNPGWLCTAPQICVCTELVGFGFFFFPTLCVNGP